MKTITVAPHDGAGGEYAGLANPVGSSPIVLIVEDKDAERLKGIIEVAAEEYASVEIRDLP
jgi:hypothetical protein